MQIFINNEEVVCDKNFTIEEELLATSSVTLNNVYPKAWETTKDYVSNFYYPTDYSICKILDGEDLIFNGIVKGFKIIFSPKDYLYLINNYREEFNGPEWLFVALTIAFILIIVGLLVFIIVFLIRKYLRFRKSVVKEEEMLEEIVNLKIKW